MSVTAVDRFNELEVRISRAIELLKTTRKEKDSAEKELAALRKQVDRLESEVAELRQERDVIKDKVETLLESLAELTEESLV